jgi:hypothetical protein
VGLDGLEEKIAILLQEGVDGEVQGVEVGRQRHGGGKREPRKGRRCGVVELVEETCEKVAVVNGKRKLNEDVAVCQVVLLKGLDSKFSFLLGGHELGGQAEGAQGESAGDGPRSVVHQRNGSLVQRGLVEELVLDEIGIELFLDVSLPSNIHHCWRVPTKLPRLAD